MAEEAGMDMILVGDSLAMTVLGHPDTVSVTMDEMLHHCKAVQRGAAAPFLVGDMPFMSYATPEQTYANAAKLMAAGASMVKMEGGSWLCDTIKGLNLRGVPVCGHLGLTPQSVHVFGGFKVQGREASQAEKLLSEAKALEEAGIQLLVLECVPSSLGKAVSEALTIPVIGIGAGKDTDGQILVMHDMFGISANYMPKFSKNYLVETGDMRKAVSKYIEDVQSGAFPSAEHSFE